MLLKNQILDKLSIADNQINEEGIGLFGEVLSNNKTLKMLDLSLFTQIIIKLEIEE